MSLQVKEIYTPDTPQTRKRFAPGQLADTLASIRDKYRKSLEISKMKKDQWEGLFPSNPKMYEQEQVGHKEGGTEYGKTGADTYAVMRHGPDGREFLDPLFMPYLDTVDGQIVADIGAGALPWSIYAAEHGAARVFAIDIQPSMLKKSEAALGQTAETVRDKITSLQGDSAYLPLQPSLVDKALSINVGCNLPSTQEGKFYSVGLGPHFAEAKRILKPGGEFVVTAPLGFGTVFTDGSLSQEEAKQRIQTVLDSVSDHHATVNEGSTELLVTNRLKDLGFVYRATFAWRQIDGIDKLVIITDEKDLRLGEDIFRKIPGMVVPNRYHTEDEYMQAAEAAGLTVIRKEKAYFRDEEEHKKYNTSAVDEGKIGPEYIANPPFVVFVFQKSKKSEEQK